MEPIARLKEQIRQLLCNPDVVQETILREVPMLRPDWGAKDEDALVHSLGVNLLAGVGRTLSYVGISEYPVPRANQWQGKLVRVDSAWFDALTREVVVLAEFERFSRDTAIEKLTNLYVAANGSENVPQALVLVLWSLDGISVETPWLRSDGPLPVSGGPPVEKPKDVPVFVLHAVFGRRGEYLHFLRLRRLT